MQSKLYLMALLLAASIFISSCSKNDSPVTPPPPVLFDTLGAGWQRIKVDTTASFLDIFFVNNQTGFLCGEKYVGKSTDGGLTWKRIVPDSLNQGFTNLFFADANNGWVTGMSFLLRTRDGGASWQKVYNRQTFDAQFFDADNGYINTGSGGGLFKTSDGALTLQPLINTPSASALFFLDQNNGWYLSDYLFKTGNAGQSLLKVSQVLDNKAYIIQFTDVLHGWIAGEGPVYRTVDGGVTLETLTARAKNGDVHFFDNKNGFVLSGNTIYSTTDGGKTLNQLCAVHKSQLIEFHFTDAGHGWATGGGGYVYRYIKP